MGPFPFEGEEDADIINVGNKPLPLYQERVSLTQHLVSNDSVRKSRFNDFGANGSF